MTAPQSLLSLILDASLRGGAFILLLLAFRPWLRRLLGSNAVGLLWLLVLVRLLLPWSLQSSWNPFPSSPPAVPAAAPSEVSPWKVTARVEDIPTPRETAPAPPAQRPRAPGELLLQFWGAGALIAALYFAARNWRTRRLVDRSRASDDARLAQVLQSIPTSLRRRVTLHVTDEIPIAALVGFWRPRILLPASWLTALNDAELRHVLLHELGHARRGDLVVQWLVALAQCLHWFNPLVWLAARSVRNDAELACDAWVLAHSAEQEYSGYGHTLLRTSQLFRDHHSMAPLAIGMAANRQTLLARIRHVGDYRPVARWQIALGLTLTVLAAASLLTRPASAEESPAATPAARPAPELKTGADIKPNAAPPQAATPSAPATSANEPAKPGSGMKFEGFTNNGHPIQSAIVPLQIEIESKFFELSEATAKKLHLMATPVHQHSNLIPDPMPLAPGVFAISGVFDENQLATLLKTLEGTKGIDLVAAPRVTTKSGQRCVVEMIREFRYPTEFEHDKKSGKAVPIAFETRNIGISMQAEPVAGPDGSTIDLNLTPEIVELEGFMGTDGQSIPLRSGRSVGANLTLSEIAGATGAATKDGILQPIFSTRKVTTSVSIWPGQTVVLGGLKREYKEGPKSLASRFLYILVTARFIDPRGAPAASHAAPSLPTALPVNPGAALNAGEADPPKAIVDQADKPRYVRSPFNPTAGLIDVNGIPSGTKLKCPYTGRVFQVP